MAKLRKDIMNENFPLYITRKRLSRFLVLHELFKKVLDVKGSIVECGVFEGFSLMTWAQFSAIYEPYNYHREIIGFDTFEGFPSLSQKDTGQHEHNIIGGQSADSYKEIMECAAKYDKQRPISHIPKVRLIKGDFLKTGEKFLKDNPHLLISLLFMDFDLYEPTKKALDLFLPRMPAGSILAFDQLNNQMWPGETTALLGKLDLNKYKLQQFYYEPNISYIML